MSNGFITTYNSIKLAILLPCQVLSIFFSLFLWIFIIRSSFKLVKSIRNHFILILLIISFIQVLIELSMVENYLFIGVVRPSTYNYCLFFNWFELTLHGTSLYVMFWTSIERHILIFSYSIFQSQWKRIIFHYIPLTIVTIYPTVIYSYLILIYNCVNNWNYNELLCTVPCFYQNKTLRTINCFANIIIPVFSIAIVNIALIIRVTFHSIKMSANLRRRRKYRKITLQLLPISSLFLACWLPISIIDLIQQFFCPTFLIDIQFDVFLYLIYFIQILLPFLCLFSLVKFKKQIIIFLQRVRRRNVVDIVPTIQQ
ncbi:hypothetical protein I4U23_009291 [Adineta vaga]|nr:hypothetical protein I4U23_009291 [Adineta vaga]